MVTPLPAKMNSSGPSWMTIVPAGRDARFAGRSPASLITTGWKYTPGKSAGPLEEELAPLDQSEFDEDDAAEAALVAAEGDKGEKPPEGDN